MGFVELRELGDAFCVVVQLVAARPTSNNPERHAPNFRCALNGKCLLVSVEQPLSIKKKRFSLNSSEFQA